ncbi:MAG: hypothetical protein RLY86_3954 [Pseudomonadota bacterium]|jgi:2'-5' RNA ligase
MIAAPLILTLKLDPASFALFERLRLLHFPPERNQIPAHLTLFHHLPGTQEEAVKGDLRRICRDTGPFPMEVVEVMALGRGCAFRLRSPVLEDLRDRLASLWDDWLIPQDRQGFRPHVTVQNKADPKQAKDTLAALRAGFTPFPVMGQGLLLWRYMNGPWEKRAEIAFRG